MSMNFEPAFDKAQIQAVHDFMARELLAELDQLQNKCKALQAALQMISNLSTLSAFDNTAEFYATLCRQLSELCQTLDIKDQLLQKIISGFGRDCFFLRFFWLLH